MLRNSFGPQFCGINGTGALIRALDESDAESQNKKKG